VKNRVGLFFVVAFLLSATVPDVGAQRPAPRHAGGSTLKPEQALPLTCVQAWVASGKRYPEMLAIVTTLAKISMANRGLTFPNTREAGVDAGRGIAEECKADPDALLFAIVDKQVRRIATPTGS
jgi:hypothetical protein